MYIGIDLGGTNIAAGLVSEQGKIIHKVSVPTMAERNYQEIVKDMAQVCLRVAQEAGVSMDEVSSIGIGSPGICDNNNGILIYANNLNFLNAPIRAEMEKYIQKPIYIENDANVAALAEYSILNEEMRCFIAITLGTGVGGGIVLDGQVYSGSNGAAGELGHMVITANGYPCTCGRKGCWEAYASATALIRQTKQALALHPESLMYSMVEGNLDNVSGKTAFIAAKQGDAAAKAVVDQYIEYVAIGIADLINIFQPEKLVIGGGVCKEGDYLLKPIQAFCENETYSSGGIVTTQISIAQLGNDAGIIGAAFLGK